MKKIALILIIFCLNGCAPPGNINAKDESMAKEVTKHTFQDVWEQVTSDPYNVLPQEKVSFWKLFKGSKNVILEDSKRTINDHSDILEPFDKLAHPNGICFRGIWEIHSDNRYSGYFRNGTKALIIARASTAMSNTRRGELRAFGLAGKIFPTKNPLELNQSNTANFFLIDDLGGTRAEHFTDVALTNEPASTITSAILKNLLYGLKVIRAFGQADENPGIRQLYEISYLNENANTTIITPKWMKVEAKEGEAVDAEDFRDELKIVSGKQLVFNVFVASESTNNKKDWLLIGAMTFDASVVSKSCDHQLHFHHPKYRSDLNF